MDRSDALSPAAALARDISERPKRRNAILRLRKRTLVSLAILGIAILAAAFANVLSPHDPSHASVLDGMTAPQWVGGEYIFGTDQIGRDILSRLLFGIRTSLLVGSSAVILSACVGILLGLTSGYAGSIVEFVIMRIVDSMMSVPGILVVMVLAFVLDPGVRTTIIALGAVGWVTYARMSRAEVKVVNSQPYILAARSMGCSPIRIAARHTFPNIANSLVVLSILQFGGAVVAEAAISFLGFGVQSPGSSLGIMLSDGRAFIGVAWWLPFFPAATIFIIVLCLNLCGEGLQDWLDPVRRRRG
ncbi:MAG: ABC transporter permease [Dehalococcoidia bacterium]